MSEQNENKTEIADAVTGIRDGVGEIQDQVNNLTERMESAENEIRKTPSMPGLEDYTDQWSWGDYVRLVKGLPCKDGFTRNVVDETRANLGASTANSPLPTEVANTIIEPLKAEATCGKAGCTFMTGLSGTINLPFGAEAELQSRGDDVTAVSDQSAAWAFEAPKTMSATYSGELVIVSRDLLAQDVPSVDAYIQKRMMMAAQRRLDVIAFAEIQGLTAKTGGADLDRALLETGLATLASYNADMTTVGLVGHPQHMYNLMQDSGSAGRTWLPFASLPALQTATGLNCLHWTGFNDSSGSNGEAVLGDFSDLIVGMFGNGIELASSEDYKFGDNAVTFRVLLSADAVIAQNNSFVHWDDLT